MIPQPIAAFEWYLKAANQGHAASQTAVGRFYLESEYKTHSISEGLKWLRKAANAGDVTAQRMLGSYLMKGYGEENVVFEAANWLEKAALSGDAQAMKYLRRCYELSEDELEDHDIAILQKEAASRGNVHAQFHFANALVRKNEEAAMMFYERAVEKGHPDAAICIAMRTKDRQRAISLVEDAVSRIHDAESTHLLASLIKDAQPERARDLFQKAADEGHVAANFEYGVLAADMKYVRYAAERNHGEAQLRVARSMTGRAGIKWCVKAAHNGVHAAWYDLGVLFEKGVYFSRREKTAFELYQKAAAGSHALGLYSLALCYEKGRGVKPDLAEALRLYEASGAQGHKPGKEAAERLRGSDRPKTPTAVGVFRY